MNPVKRLIWCALLFGIQALYFPLNKYMQGGMEFKTPMDEHMPVWPIWVIPYACICGWWTVAYLWAAADGRPIVRSVFHLVRGDAGLGVDHFYALPDLHHASHGVCHGLVVTAPELDLCT